MNELGIPISRIDALAVANAALERAEHERLVAVQHDNADFEFDITLVDGRRAHCWQAEHIDYDGMIISAGLAEGVDFDEFYLRLARDGEEPLTLFLRRDELAAILHVGAGALWSQMLLDVGVKKDGTR